jgi:ABC-type polysaccharide/polyol phosphate export permease
VIAEIIRAVRLWPIWLRLGVQDVRLRFRRSAVGVAWIFMNLAITVFAVGFVYSHLLGQELKDFLPFLTAGIILWGYLTSAITEGSNAFLAAEGYIKQIGLPLYVYILRVFVSVSVVLFLSIGAYFAVAFFYRVELHGGTLWAVPGLALVGVVALLFIAIFAYVNARFRDAVHLATAFLQVLFYITPIIWPPQVLHDRGVSWVINYNPFYHLLEVVRQPLLHSEPATSVSYLVVGVFIAGLTLVSWGCAWYYHHRVVYFL